MLKKKIQNKNKTKTKHGTHRYREQIGGCQRWGWGMEKWVKVVKRYKLPVMKSVSPGDVSQSQCGDFS